MTLEEIGRRAVALTEARSDFRSLAACENRYAGTGAVDDPDEGPCWIDLPDDPDEWCDGCKRREGLAEARRMAARELSVAVNTYRRAQARKKAQDA